MGDFTLTPHGFCLLWEPGLIWLHAASDCLTGLAYFSIPVALVVFARRRRDIDFSWLPFVFAAFILACGATHFLAVLTLWVPAYWLEGTVKAVTAVLSVFTATMLWPLLPQLVALPSPKELQQTNLKLREQEAHSSELNRTLVLAEQIAHVGHWRIDLADGRFTWSDELFRIYGLSRGGFVPTMANCAEAFHPDDRHAVRQMFQESPAAGEDSDLAVRLLRADGELRHVLIHATREVAVGGKVTARVGVLLDITAQKNVENQLKLANADLSAAHAALAAKARQEREDASALLRTMVNASPGLVYAKDRRGRMLIANDATLALIGRPWSEVVGKSDREFLTDTDQADIIMGNDDRIMALDHVEELEEVVSGALPHARVWLSKKSPLHDGAGNVVGLVGMSMDITERKQTEEGLKLLVNELNHRVKNTLSTVQSIVLHTLGDSDAATRDKLDARLLALATAHDVLTQRHWAGALLQEVVRNVLAPHGGGESDKFRWSGPVVWLKPAIALTLSTALHELASNAVQHGALSGEGGHVCIDWETTTGAAPLFRLVWSEVGGPPVAPPRKRGFGTLLLERILSQDLRGTTTVTYLPDGVTCVVESPLAEVADPGEPSPAFRDFLKDGVRARELHDH